MNVASVADKLAQDIRTQDSLHEPMVKDLAKLAASSTVTEEDFHSTFLKALGRYVYFIYLWAQSFTSLKADLRQDINGDFAFNRSLNGTFP